MIDPSSYSCESGDASQEVLELVPRGRWILYVLVTALFVLWGVANTLNHLLIHQFMKLFGMSRLEASLIQTFYYFGYSAFALPAFFLLQRRGFRSTLLVGLVVFGCGGLCFWPAAVAGKFFWFLISLFVVAVGVSLLETSAGTFIQQMGSGATAARRVNLSQAFQSLGAAGGALAGSAFIFSGNEYGLVSQLPIGARSARNFQAEAHRVIGPYVCLSLAALILGMLLRTREFPRIGDYVSGSPWQALQRLSRDLRFRSAWVASFLYMGAQIGTWSFLLQYVQQFTRSHEKLAGILLSGTLGAFGLGRFVSVLIMRFVPARRLLTAYSAINCLLITSAVIHPGWTGVWAIFISSFFMSVMYPTIFSYALEGRNADSKLAGAIMVTTLAAGGIIPTGMALLAQYTGSYAWAYAIPEVFYGLIFLLAFRWLRPSATVF